MQKCHFYWIFLFDNELPNQGIKTITTFITKKFGIQNSIFLFSCFLCSENKSTSSGLETFTFPNCSTKLTKINSRRLFNMAYFTLINLIPDIFLCFGWHFV